LLSARDTGLVDDEHRDGFLRRIGQEIRQWRLWRWSEAHPRLTLLFVVPPLSIIGCIALIIATALFVPSSVPVWQRGDAMASVLAIFVTIGIVLFYLCRILWRFRDR